MGRDSLTSSGSSHSEFAGDLDNERCLSGPLGPWHDPELFRCRMGAES
jgi:hypothetical protein